MNRINKIIKLIEELGETVIHEGIFCLSVDLKDSSLLWSKKTGWLGIREDITYFSKIQDKHITQFRNIPIYKKNSGKIYFLDPELDKILEEMKS